MSRFLLIKPLLLAVIFIKEQLKEPIALFWVLISPVLTFYLIIYAKSSDASLPASYLENTAWFYAFVASSVAFFGLAFYMVGRRESGFLRSFVYARRARITFMLGQFIAYSVVSIAYCAAFYVCTRGYFGDLSFFEFFIVLGRFYVCYLLFSSVSLLLTLVPMGFQNANTAFSMLSFLMLALGIASVSISNPVLDMLKLLNPMWWANQIMLSGAAGSLFVMLFAAVSFIISFFTVYRFLLVSPAWSRY